MSYREIPLSENVIKRFWSHVPRLDDNVCWEWIGTRKSGRRDYGILYINNRQFGAHRISHLIHKGPIADGMIVRHSCDNYPCVNPAHLDEGTHRQNMIDALVRERDPRRFSNHQVAIIRKLYVFGLGCRDLGRLFGKDESTIRYICRTGRAHVGWPEIIDTGFNTRLRDMLTEIVDG